MRLLKIFGLVLGVIFAVPAAIASAEPYDDVETRNLEVVRSGLDAWRAGTGSPYDALADDATWEVTGNSLAARTYTSKEDFLANVIRPFNARMSQGLKPTVRDLYADGDTVVAFFDAEGVARDGVPYRNAASLRSDFGVITVAGRTESRRNHLEVGRFPSTTSCGYSS